MNPGPLEKEIEKKVVEHAKKLGCYVRKFTSPAHRSVPDRMFISPNGVVWFIEFKRLGQKPTAGQEVEIEKIRKTGVKVFVCDTVEDGKRVVDAMVKVQRDVLVGGTNMTNVLRIQSYREKTKMPLSLFVGEDGRIVGTWIMGNDYRVKSEYYGGYPAGYLRRVKALFPDKQRVLHLFSGKVDTVEMPGKTVDINPANGADYVDNAQTLEKVPIEEFDLVMADPPYSVEDCERYQTSMVKRNKVMAALGSRLSQGAHVVWLDQVLPMYRKNQFNLIGVIGMVKSTNHRFRVVTIFEKRDPLDSF